MLSILSIAPGAVSLKPGDDIQQIVEQNVAGTEYRLAAGTYELQQITPHDGDSFIGAGAPATRLVGARVLDNFSTVTIAGRQLYVARNQTQSGQVHGECAAGRPRCNYSQDLYFDRAPLRHVNSAAAVAAGSWYFAYAEHSIYFADDPAGHEVTASVARRAFGGSAANVTVSDLAVEQYAVPAQMGAVGDQAPGPGWTISRVTATLNHGAGINVGPRGSILDCNASDNGQIGVKASGAGARVEGNELAGNNWAGFLWGWEAGGS
jgi:hypothetical protein